MTFILIFYFKPNFRRPKKKKLIKIKIIWNGNDIKQNIKKKTLKYIYW